MSNSKQLRVSLSEQDADYLKEIAAKLGIKESEVMKKGLQLMALYAKTKASGGDSALIMKTSEDGNEREVMII